MVNLSASEEVVGEPFFSRPYAEMTYMDANEEKTITLYGGTLKRSIYYVAQQVDASGSFKGTSYDSFVQNLLALGKAYEEKQAAGNNGNSTEGGTGTGSESGNGGSESTNTPNS